MCILWYLLGRNDVLYMIICSCQIPFLHICKKLNIFSSALVMRLCCKPLTGKHEIKHKSRLREIQMTISQWSRLHVPQGSSVKDFSREKLEKLFTDSIKKLKAKDKQLLEVTTERDTLVKQLSSNQDQAEESTALQAQLKVRLTIRLMPLPVFLFSAIFLDLCRFVDFCKLRGSVTRQWSCVTWCLVLDDNRDKV